MSDELTAADFIAVVTTMVPAVTLKTLADALVIAALESSWTS